jgi:hypothetical protein
MAYNKIVLSWHQTKLLFCIVVVCSASGGMAVVIVVRKYFGERNWRWLGRAK